MEFPALPRPDEEVGIEKRVIAEHGSRGFGVHGSMDREAALPEACTQPLRDREITVLKSFGNKKKKKNRGRRCSGAIEVSPQKKR